MNYPTKFTRVSDEVRSNGEIMHTVRPSYDKYLSHIIQYGSSLQSYFVEIDMEGVNLQTLKRDPNDEDFFYFALSRGMYNEDQFADLEVLLTKPPASGHIVKGVITFLPDKGGRKTFAEIVVHDYDPIDAIVYAHIVTEIK